MKASALCRETILSNIAPCPVTGCWFWLGSMTNTGYGSIYIHPKNQRTHRVSYELFKGPIPAGLVIDHLCRQPLCCNPDHLEPVTDKVNALRGYGACAQHARKTHCPKGHPLSGDNLVKSIPRRQCRTCTNEQSRVNSAKANGRATKERWNRKRSVARIRAKLEAGKPLTGFSDKALAWAWEEGLIKPLC